MGWGFGIIVDRTDTDKAMNTLEQDSVKTEIIGKITDRQQVEVSYKGKKMILA